MAPSDDTPRPKRTGTSIAVWILVILLIGGLGGFGVTSFGGNIRTIGQVGDRDIPVDAYARALRAQLDAVSAQFGLPLTFAQAQAFGIDRQVLQSVITEAALDNEADRIGLSVGDAVVAAQVSAMPAFQGPAGSFDRETYRFTLARNNLGEAAFETTLRQDLARSLLQGAVVGGFAAPGSLTGTLWAYAGEQRSFTVLPLTEADLATPLPDPVEADLVAYHQTNIARYTRGEAKRITYAALMPATLAPEQPVDEAALQAAYQARIDTYMIPERRLVERLVFPTDADATAARSRLDAGTPFETLVAERGLALQDIDLGDVARTDLGAAGDAVFSLTEPGVVGPIASDLGPAILRMNAVLAAQETTFAEARPTLLQELQVEAARKSIGDRVEAVDDLLAGGAALEDLARDEGMDLVTLDYVPGAADNADIAGSALFRTAADAVAAGDFPEAVLLEDGGLLAMRLDETVPPAPLPLATVRDAVATAWRAQVLSAALSVRALEIKAAVEAGAALASQGTTTTARDIDRQSSVAGAPPEVVQAAFQMQPGDLRVIETAGFTALLLLDAVAPAPETGEAALAMREAIRIEQERALAQDAFTLFTDALSAEAGITLDQAAINAVNAQFN